MSIRARVIALSTAAVAIAVVIALFAAYFAVRSELISQIDDSLRAQSRFAVAASDSGLIFKRDLKLPDQARRLAVVPSGDTGLALQGVASSGVRREIGPTGPTFPIAAADRSIAKQGSGTTITDVQTASGDHYRVATAGVGSAGAIMIGRSLEGVDQLLGNLRIVLGILILAGIGIAGLLGFLVARSISRPVIELSDAADEIARTNDLSKRIEVSRDDEVGRLGENFNRMLDRIEDSQSALELSVESQRQLVADASHELRTPVAAVRTDVETMLSHPDLPDADRERILGEATASLGELADLINDVIELARGDEQTEHIEHTRLDQIASESIDRFRRLAPDRVVNEQLEPCVVEGRPDRIGRAINNLLDNAQKYGAADTAIDITVSSGKVVVADRGPGIPAADQPHIFDRFWRGGDSRRVPGSGLGLAIVRQVADAHGGSVAVEDREGGGSLFVLKLPEAE